MRYRTLLALLFVLGLTAGCSAVGAQTEPASPIRGGELPRVDQTVSDIEHWYKVDSLNKFFAELQRQEQARIDADKKEAQARIDAAKKAAASRSSQGRSVVPTEVSGSQDRWDWLADCETGTRIDGIVQPGTRRNDAGGGFDGYFQFLDSTWKNMGNTGRAYEHSYAVQKAQAQRIPLTAWPSQFPDCTRRLKRMGVI